MISVLVVVSLAIGFAVGSITGFALGLDMRRGSDARADIRPALRRQR